MSFLEFCTIIYTQFEPDNPWYTFYRTRDWYDMPASREKNDLLYRDTEDYRKSNYWQQESGRLYIYPKDIQYIYDCTPKAARSLLNDMREALGLSVSGPVTHYDFEEYTGLDMQTIQDFIIES